MARACVAQCLCIFQVQTLLECSSHALVQAAVASVVDHSYPWMPALLVALVIKARRWVLSTGIEMQRLLIIVYSAATETVTMGHSAAMWQLA